MVSSRLVRCAAVAAALLVPVIAAAQSSTTGAIAGVARDDSGGVLPGVTVEVSSPALIEKVRSAVTDGQGNYKVSDLRPGVYAVTFTLTGFSVVRREGIDLSVGFTAPVNADMKVGALTETITVTGASPVVDVQSARTQQVMKAEVLEALPSGMKDLTALTTLTLGATTSTLRNDVGGDKGELSTGIAIHGSRGDDSRTNYDGMSTNNFYGGGGGQQRTYKFNTVAVAETVVDTGGSGAETETGGANINMVPKDGGNRFSLNAPFSYTGQDFASGKVPASLLARGSADNQNSMKKVYDYGVGVGGPIRKDKMWFYSANRWWGNQGYAANNYFNKSNAFYRYEADLSRPAYSDQYYTDIGVRLTWQATSKHKITFSENYQTSCACWMGIGGTTAPEAAVSYVYGTSDYPELLTQSTWTYPHTNKLLFQGGFSFLRQAVSFQSRGGPIPNSTRVTDQARGYSWGGLTGGVINDLGTPQNQNNGGYRGSASYVTGSHAWKVGVQGLFGNYNTRGNLPSGVNYTFNNGVPVSITQYATPFVNDSEIRSLGLFASDQWTVKRLTLSYGVRYDHFNAYTRDVTAPAGLFIGERTYPAIKNVPTFDDVTPRVAAAFDVFGTGKTAIKASWGRYLLGWGGGAFNFVAPANAVAANATRQWTDANSNFVPDCDLVNRLANGECGQVSNLNFGAPAVNLTWDERARKGWGVRDRNHQVSVTLQHELRPNLGIQGGYYWTSWDNTQVIVNQAVSAGDFTEYCITAPADDRLGPASGQQVCGLYDVNFDKRGQVRSVWMRTKDVAGVDGQRTDVYNGFDIATNWRFRGRGLLSGGVSFGRSVVNDCYANKRNDIVQNVVTLVPAAVGIRDAKYCENKPPFWSGVGSQIKLQAVYPLPFDFMVSAVYKHLPGIPITATVTVPNASIVPSLGRNLSACNAPTGACNATASVNVVLPNSVFDDRLNQIDTRLTRSFRFGGIRIQAIAEVYNLTNTRPSQSNQTAYGVLGATPNAAYLRPTSILGGRLFKVGGQFDWQ